MKKNKRASTLLTTFGGGEDEEAGSRDPASIADRVDVKLMIPRAMRDELDLAAARKYGRGRMRTMLIESVLREYLKSEAAREEPEERGRPWGS